MATRATYQINSTTFYCHWDGYEEGAAHRFANMVAALTVCEDPKSYRIVEDRRGGLEFAFIRGNIDAEPISSHGDVGGTEYRYTVSTDKRGAAMIKVEAVNKDDSTWFHHPTWRVLFHGDLAAWINRARNGDFGTPEVVRIDEDHVTTYATAEAAREIAKAYDDYGQTFGEDNPNRAGYVRQARDWFKAVDNLRPDAESA